MGPGLALGLRPGPALGPGITNNVRVGPSSTDNIRGRVAQEYFGLSRAIYLQRKSYLYSHATHGTVRVIWHCLRCKRGKHVD
jgi:hypothetical protein